MILIEKKPMDTIGRTERLLLYYYLFQKSESSSQDEWVTVFNQIRRLDKKSRNDIAAQIDCQVIADMVDYHVISQDDMRSTKDGLNKFFSLLNKEIEGERKAFDYMNDLANRHPIISRLIVTLLTGILTSILGNIVYTAVTTNDVNKENVHPYSLYIYQNDQMEEICLDEYNSFSITKVDEHNIKVTNDADTE